MPEDFSDAGSSISTVQPLACGAFETPARLTLALAEPGRTYHVTSLGFSRAARLELLSAGLAPDTTLNLLRGEGRRPRIVACGEIRVAVGEELAGCIELAPCGCGCGCNGGREKA